MKKISILMIAAAMIFAGNTYAQVEQGAIRANVGLALGTKAGIDNNGKDKAGLGINAGLEYFVTEALSLAPSYTMFFKSTVNGVDFKLSSINIDARYYFVTEGTQLYGLAGFGSVKAKAEGGGASISTSETGLNIGAGAIFPMGDSAGINAQLKYATPGDGQIVANVGVVFSF